MENLPEPLGKRKVKNHRNWEKSLALWVRIWYDNLAYVEPSIHPADGLTAAFRTCIQNLRRRLGGSFAAVKLKFMVIWRIFWRLCRSEIRRPLYGDTEYR